ncbi:hypothetical protein NC652_024486 [Populus alba x Populus x berolinensis]|nr:hypothetical protein NC652_024486 [Populus alba x Populus x berolinensis]
MKTPQKIPGYYQDRAMSSLTLSQKAKLLIFNASWQDTNQVNKAENGKEKAAVISGFSALPWLIKPLYGFISDSVPLFGYRRRSYLVLSGLLGALSWSLMSTCVDSKYSAASAYFLDHFLLLSQMLLWIPWWWRGLVGSHKACQDLFSLYVGGRRLLVGLFVFGVTALLPLITSAVAVLVREQRVLGPASGLGLALPGTNKLGFTQEFLGCVKLVTSVASLLGVGLYNGFLKKCSHLRIDSLLLTTVTELQLPWETQVSFMPVLDASGDSLCFRERAWIATLFANHYVHFKWRQCFLEG